MRCRSFETIVEFQAAPDVALDVTNYRTTHPIWQEPNDIQTGYSRRRNKHMP